MASSSLSSSYAPTFSSRLWKYHVFVSFKEDTHKPFVANLYTALEKKGICTYKDDTTHPRDESVGPSLEAIKESHIAIIVFSENYADSSWCLEELAYIMKIKGTGGQIVLPIFYDVDASAVRKQKRKYGEAFTKHEVANKNKVESWRKALEDASNLSGRKPKNIAKGHESQGIKQIVDTISQMLHLVTSSANENLIGIEARIQDLKSKLEIGSVGVRMVGVWGVGGGGKTTLASCVYDEIYSEFDGCCFIKNIRAESSRYGLGKLQENILSSILKEKQVQVIQRVEEGRRKIMGSLCCRKVLIVLDDVDHPDQLEALAGSHDWFGEGSRIIITARDAHLLATRRVVVMHNISLLNEDEAIELFRKYGADYIPMEYYELLSKDVVSYAGGHPLALRVLGCFLCDKEIDVWRSALARLKEIANDNILEKLKISFDGLKPVEKELFLDIACFFTREDKDKAMEILGACCFYPVLGLNVLIQKDLIAITDGIFDMHNLVQEMGHYIVQGEHPENPEKHSRVWKKEDVAKICTMDVTTELDMIEAIRLKRNGVDALHLPLIVANMKRLRWIDWEGDLASPLPIKFSQVELCCLKLDGISQKVLWEGFKYLPHLIMLELYGLHNLIMTPDFDGLPRLQRLKIAKCWYLEDIHPSIGRMKRLIFLSIEFCFGLKMFPRLTGLKKLETLTFSRCPKLFKLSEIQQQNMKHIGLQFSHVGLRKLDLMYCDLGDEDIGSAVWELPNVENLNVTGNKFSGLDFSLLQLPRLKWLNISYCARLVKLSELPSSIGVLIADHCTSLETFGDVSNCKLLWKVSLRGVNKLGPLGGDILLHSMIQENTIEDHFISVTLENQNPEGFVGRLYRGKTFTLHLPDDWYNDFCGFLICLVTDMKSPQINIIIKQEADEEDSRFELWQEEYTEAVEPEYDGTTTSVGYISFNSLRHTTLLTLSYNIISFSIEDGFSALNAADSHVWAELVPRKSKDDQAYTADYSEFCAKELEYGNTFTIKHDSKSSIKIQWFPYNNRNTEVTGLNQVSSHKRVREPREPRITVQTTSEVDDGYIWRKYGQKDILGSPYPRSYYRCTSKFQGCNATKQVERDATDPKALKTTYIGKHNHDVPTPINSSHNMAITASTTTTTQSPNHGGDSETSFLDKVSSHQTVTEPQVIVQTPSESDLPDDGYIWRKYGHKYILGSPYPRGYYRCTSKFQGCKALKQVQRDASDPKALKITYSGKHNHDVPAPKNSSHNMTDTASTTTTQLPSHSGDSGISFLDEVSFHHRTVTEPQIILQTTSESDISDDGYIWPEEELELC